MKRSVIFLFLFSACLTFAQDSSFNNSFWLLKNIKWHKPNTGDPELDTLQLFTRLKAIAFVDSVFIKVSCPANKGTRWDSINLEATPTSIYKGIWKYENDSVITVSCQVADHKNPQESFVRKQIFIRKEVIMFENESYEVNDKLTVKSVSRLNRYIGIPFEKLLDLVYDQ